MAGREEIIESSSPVKVKNEDQNQSLTYTSSPAKVKKEDENQTSTYNSSPVKVEDQKLTALSVNTNVNNVPKNTRSKNVKTTQNKTQAVTKGKNGVMTDYFQQARKSGRKTKKELKLEQERDLEIKIKERCEEGLKVSVAFIT